MQKNLFKCFFTQLKKISHQYLQQPPVFATICIMAALTPFARSVENTNSTIIKISGKVKRISSFPSPQDSSYPDCFYTVLLENQGADGKITEYLVLLKCFEKFALIPKNIVKPEECLQIEAVPFNDLSENDKTIQRTDDIERFDLECYVAINVLRNITQEKTLPDRKINGKKTIKLFTPPHQYLQK